MKTLSGVLQTALVLWAGAVSASEIGPEAFAEAGQADVVIVGEVHDNPYHHDNQARFAAELQPKAIVFEMLRPGDPAVIRQHATVEEIAKALDWAERGWPAYAMYHPIIAAAPGAQVFGAELPRDQVRAAVTETAAVVFTGDAARFGLDQPLPPAEQAAREARQLAVHCDALPAEMLPGMVEAQRLRDAALAEVILQAHALPGATPVLVITGNGHADREWGIPPYLAQAASELSLYIVQQYEVDAPARIRSDAQLVTEPIERPDPCEAFR